jgi:hypothetical protein
MDVSTGEVGAVSEVDRYNCTPDWFPDSKRVIYARGIIPAMGGYAQLWVAKVGEKETRPLYAEEGRHIYGGATSPDGRYLLFTRSEQDLGAVDNSRTRIAVMRFQDAPVILGPCADLGQRHPNAKNGPVLDLSWGWEPHWTAHEKPMQAESRKELEVRVSWGHRSAQGTPFTVKPLTEGMRLAHTLAMDMEPDEGVRDGAWKTHAGGSDVDAIVLTLTYPDIPVKETENLHVIWRYLFEHSDADTASRLRSDPAFRPDPRTLTIQMDQEGTKGFSLTLDQLLRQRAFWIPAMDVYVTAGGAPLRLADYTKELEPWTGRRILDQVRSEPDATYEQFTARWDDMADPRYRNPAQQGPGHIVCVSWDSAIPKFGIDRGAGVWNDLGNPDQFRFWFDFGVLAESWRSQRLADGLPVITTVFEKGGLRYEVEQFAHPLGDPPDQRRGDIPMVLLQKVRVTNLQPSAREVSVVGYHQRGRPASAEIDLIPLGGNNVFLLEDGVSRDALLSVEGRDLRLQLDNHPDSGKTADDKKSAGSVASQVTISLNLAGHGSQEFVVRLPSPVVAPTDRDRLLRVEYDQVRSQTLE